MRQQCLLPFAATPIDHLIYAGTHKMEISWFETFDTQHIETCWDKGLRGRVWSLFVVAKA